LGNGLEGSGLYGHSDCQSFTVTATEDRESRLGFRPHNRGETEPMSNCVNQLLSRSTPRSNLGFAMPCLGQPLLFVVFKDSSCHIDFLSVCFLFYRQEQITLVLKQIARVIYKILFCEAIIMPTIK